MPIINWTCFHGTNKFESKCNTFHRIIGSASKTETLDMLYEDKKNMKNIRWRLLITSGNLEI